MCDRNNRAGGASAPKVENSTPIFDLIRRSMGLLPDRTGMGTAVGPVRDISTGAPALRLNAGDCERVSPIPNCEQDDHQLLASAAAEIYRMRRARDRVLWSGLGGEPGWDMLLALYVEEPSGVPVSSLCYASAVPLTTAMRWIGVLEQQGLAQRVGHQRDCSLILVALTDRGRAMTESSLRAMLRAAAP